MDVEKLRSLTDAELLHQQQELNDQLFRLKFQLKMGQTESLTKIRGLRKDVARVHTVIREKELGITAPSNGHKAEAAGDAEAKPKTNRPPPARAPRRKRPRLPQKAKQPSRPRRRPQPRRGKSKWQRQQRKNKAAAAPRLAA